MDSRRTKQTWDSPGAPVADSSGLGGAASWSGACWWDWNWPGRKTRNLNQRPWHLSHSGKDNRKWELGHLSWVTKILYSTPPFKSKPTFKWWHSCIEEISMSGAHQELAWWPGKLLQHFPFNTDIVKLKSQPLKWKPHFFCGSLAVLTTVHKPTSLIYRSKKNIRIYDKDPIPSLQLI